MNPKELAEIPLPPTSIPAWHAVTWQSALELLESNADGLGASEATHRLGQVGPNAIQVADPVPLWRLLVAQLKSLVVALLAMAAGVALLIGDGVEAAAIGAVLLANTFIGFWVEWRARTAMEALRRIQISAATVLREGKPLRVDARGLVPGDVLLLEEGEAIPADARLISTQELRVIEAPLTGEPAPVSKDVAPVGGQADRSAVPLAERRSMVYKGTLAVAGSGRAVTVGTGRNTEIGRIAELVQATQAEETPLEVRLDALGRRLVGATLGIALLVTVLGVARGGEAWLMLETGIALAIAAVPEGLPVVATITLALGMRRMAQRHALVRSLPAVESLGSATIVCADKTGTLTGGLMTATRLEVAGWRVEVSGTGMEVQGEFSPASEAPEPGEAPLFEVALQRALEVGVLANRARLRIEGAGRDAVRASGDPTEVALLILGRKLGIEREQLVAAYPEVGGISFTSERRLMATFHQHPDGGRILFVKGAPGRILGASTHRLSGDGPVPLSEGEKEALVERNRELGREGLRVLALATRRLPENVELGEEAVTELEFVGLVGIEDPPAPGVRDTIELLANAGVRTVMITGDQTVTAEAVGRQLGLAGGPGQTLEGRELMEMSDEELAHRIETATIFSRIEPADKLRIVKSFQGRGEVVAMLGDGVNDAPALKRADIGVAMGGRGTDVAKETAGLVLQDDRFETIGVAVEEGRVVFDNIRKFIFYLFSCNLSEVLVILGASLAGLPMPLLPLQILWLNLVTDVFPALALAVEPPEEDVMSRPPRPPDAAILSRPFLSLVVRYAISITAATLAAFIYSLQGAPDSARAVTVAFMTLALSQLFHVFNARSHAQVLFSRRLFQNGWVWSAIALTIALQVMAVHFPPLAGLLHTVPLSRGDWGVVMAASLFPLLFGQIVKTLRS